LIKHLLDKQWNVIVVTSSKALEKQGNGRTAFGLDSSIFYDYANFLASDEEYFDFTKYLIEAYNVGLLFIVGSLFFYNNLYKIKKIFPSLKIIDQHFNEFGHLNSYIRNRTYINKTILATDSLKAYLDAHIKDSNIESQVILHGIDTDREFNPMKVIPNVLGFIHSDLPVVGYFGRFSDEKRPDLFVELAARLNELGMYYNYLMVGDGDHFKKVQDSIQSKGLTPYFYLTGFVADIKPFLRNCSLVIIPSIVEGVPLILLEALSFGIPVVASAVGGIPRVLKSGEFGKACDPANFNSYIDAVVDIMKDNDNWLEKSKKARSHIVRNYGVHHMLSKYQQVFEEVVMTGSKA